MSGKELPKLSKASSLAGAIASKVCSDIKTYLESWLATGRIVELSRRVNSVWLELQLPRNAAGAVLQASLSPKPPS